MILTTSDFENFDTCERKYLWSRKWLFPRISLMGAMYKALDAGLVSGSPQTAKDTLMSLAANPGLDIQGYAVYDIAVHHAALIEILTTYLLGKGEAWIPAHPVKLDNHEYQPESYLMPDGRLRRVVLCAWFDDARKLKEAHGWRTVGDIAATGRPMLLNALTIGNSRQGMRHSPWTRGFLHPTNKTLRIQRVAQREKEPFSDSWKKVWRERTDFGIPEWLKVMQQDNAFEGNVNSFAVPVSENRELLEREMLERIKEMATAKDRMRRSGCFGLSPCGFAKVCHLSYMTNPGQNNWKSRDNS
jgi:hypothetical protein